MMRTTTVENAINSKQGLTNETSIGEAKKITQHYKRVLRNLHKEVLHVANQKAAAKGIVFNQREIKNLKRLRTQGQVEVEYKFDTIGYSDPGAYYHYRYNSDDRYAQTIRVKLKEVLQ